MTPAPIVLRWRSQDVRIRHDNPGLTPYSPRGAQLRSAIELASDVDGLRLVLAPCLGDRYRVRATDDGSVVGLRRLT